MTLSSDFTEQATVDTQRQALLSWLIERGAITRMEALNQLGILQLPARILELRRDGWPIETHRYEVEMAGKVAKYAKYVLPQPTTTEWRF